jgi:AraC-like DNA-binding protein
VSDAAGTKPRTSDRTPPALVGTSSAEPSAAARGLSVPVLVRLRQAKDLIDRRYAEPLDLAALAAEAGFSRYHFARLFHAAYGLPPGAYLSRRRVERAQDLLRSADVTVTEVCLLVGFTSLGSFSSRFRQLVGMSPSQYRHRLARTPLPVPACFAVAWSSPGQRPVEGKSRCAILEKPTRTPAG